MVVCVVFVVGWFIDFYFLVFIWVDIWIVYSRFLLCFVGLCWLVLGIGFLSIVELNGVEL